MKTAFRIQKATTHHQQANQLLSPLSEALVSLLHDPLAGFTFANEEVVATFSEGNRCSQAQLPPETIDKLLNSDRQGAFEILEAHRI